MASFYDRVRGFLGARDHVRPMTEQGTPGYAVYGGYIVKPEQNTDLIGQNRWRTASDLLANISIIAASLRYTLNLISRPSWRFEPADESDEAKAVAELFESIFDEIDSGWTRIVRRAGMYRYHGFSVNEWVAKKREDGKIGLQSIESRPQHTIEKWDIDDVGNILGVMQRDPQNGQERYLPRGKLLYLVDDTLTDSPDGMGWFRHLAEPAKRLKSYLEIEGFGFERDLSGIPVGRMPIEEINALVEAGTLKESDAARMRQMLVDFVSMRRKKSDTGIVLSSKPYLSKTETGNTVSGAPQWGIELITGSQNSIEEIGQAVERIEFEMALIMGTESMLVGRGGEGSRALSEDKSRNLYLTGNATLSDMAEGVQLDLVKTIGKLNGIPDKLLPKAKVEDVSFKDAEMIAKTLADMAQAGAVLAPNDPAINDLRDLLGISHAEEMDMAMLNAIQGRPDPTKPSPADELADQRTREMSEAERQAAAEAVNDNKQPQQAAAKVPARKAERRTLYVQRRLLNSAPLIRWAKKAGFKTTVPAEELHVTVCYSRRPLDWMAVSENYSGDMDGRLRVHGGPRLLEQFNGGAIVLLFKDEALEWRHEQFKSAGASFDFEKFQPHVTLTFDGGDIDLATVEPYQGELIFGPEEFAEVNEDWKAGITEKGGEPSGEPGKPDEGDAALKAFNPSQPRDPKGSATGGRWTATGTSGGYHEGEPAEELKVAPVVREYLSDEEIEEVKALINSDTSTAPEILEKLSPIDAMSRGMETTIAEGVDMPDADWWSARQYVEGRGIEDTLNHLDGVAANYAGDAGPAQERKAMIILGPPAAGKSTSAEAIAKSGRYAIVDPDDAKKVIPEYRGGIGAHAVHEESSFMSSAVKARAMARGDNIILPTVGASAASVRKKIDQFKAAGYTVDVALVDVHPNVAARRMAGRTLRSGRHISSSYALSIGDGPKKAYSSLRDEIGDVGFARIEANGPMGSEYYAEVKGIDGLRSGQSVFGGK